MYLVSIHLSSSDIRHPAKKCDVISHLPHNCLFPSMPIYSDPFVFIPQSQIVAYTATIYLLKLWRSAHTFEDAS